MPPGRGTPRDSARNTTPCRFPRRTRGAIPRGIALMTSPCRPPALRYRRHRCSAPRRSSSAPALRRGAQCDEGAGIERAEEQIVDGPDLGADAVDFRPAGRRQAQQHPAPVLRIGLLEQQPQARHLAGLRRDEGARHVHRLRERSRRSPRARPADGRLRSAGCIAVRSIPMRRPRWVRMISIRLAIVKRSLTSVRKRRSEPLSSNAAAETVGGSA